MIKLITFDWWHYLLIQVWLRWPRIPPGIWTGDTNCSPNTSSLLFVLVTPLFAGQLSTAESCRDPDMFSARPGVGAWTIAAPGPGPHAMMGTGLKKARSRFYATQHSLRGVSSAIERTLAAYTTHKMLGPRLGRHVPSQRGRRSSYETFKICPNFYTRAQTGMQGDFNGVKVEKRVLDNTEKINDPDGGKWSPFICHPCLFPF